MDVRPCCPFHFGVGHGDAYVSFRSCRCCLCDDVSLHLGTYHGIPCSVRMSHCFPSSVCLYHVYKTWLKHFLGKNLLSLTTAAPWLVFTISMILVIPIATAVSASVIAWWGPSATLLLVWAFVATFSFAGKLALLISRCTLRRLIVMVCLFFCNYLRQVSLLSQLGESLT